MPEVVAGYASGRLRRGRWRRVVGRQRMAPPGRSGRSEGEVSEVALGEVFRIGRAYLAHTAGGVTMGVWARWCVRPSRAMGPGSPR